MLQDEAFAIGFHFFFCVCVCVWFILQHKCYISWDWLFASHKWARQNIATCTEFYDVLQRLPQYAVAELSIATKFKPKYPRHGAQHDDILGMRRRHPNITLLLCVTNPWRPHSVTFNIRKSTHALNHTWLCHPFTFKNGQRSLTPCTSTRDDAQVHRVLAIYSTLHSYPSWHVCVCMCACVRVRAII